MSPFRRTLISSSAPWTLWKNAPSTPTWNTSQWPVLRLVQTSRSVTICCGFVLYNTTIDASSFAAIAHSWIILSFLFPGPFLVCPLLQNWLCAGSGSSARSPLHQWTDGPTCSRHPNTGQTAVQPAGQQRAGTHAAGGQNHPTQH